MPFPDGCIRGITSLDHILDPDVVSSAVFQFQDVGDRNQEWDEISINWNDDVHALEVLLGQRKENGDMQFKGGGAHLPRKAIDSLKALPLGVGRLSYERKPIDYNPYHGNVLLKKGTRPAIRKLIQAALAAAVTHIDDQDE